MLRQLQLSRVSHVKTTIWIKLVFITEATFDILPFAVMGQRFLQNMCTSPTTLFQTPNFVIFQLFLICCQFSIIIASCWWYRASSFKTSNGYCHRWRQQLRKFQSIIINCHVAFKNFRMTSDNCLFSLRYSNYEPLHHIVSMYMFYREHQMLFSVLQYTDTVGFNRNGTRLVKVVKLLQQQFQNVHIEWSDLILSNSAITASSTKNWNYQ